MYPMSYDIVAICMATKEKSKSNYFVKMNHFSKLASINFT